MTQSKPFPWLRHVRLCGGEGERWADEYERRLPLVRACQEAVDVLRRHRHDEGEALLRQARGELAALGASLDPSVRAVIERYYYGALGYQHYAREEFDLATAAMDRAHQAVAQAIAHRRWLVVLVLDCHEFELHRARIARERQEWRAMRRHTETATEMRDGRRPFCVLSDGTAVGLEDLRAFYRALPPLPDEDAEIVAPFMDDRRSRVNAERSARYVFRLANAVIQYP